MRIELVTLGDELLDGRVVDGNAAWLGGRLADLGLLANRRTTLPDAVAPITRLLLAVAARADWCLISGGLGPTDDDLTIDALATAAGVGFSHDAATLDRIRARFGERPMPESNARQARVPEGGTLLPTDVGTAPGMLLRIGDCTFVCMPGVPSEMRWHFETHVAPRLKAEMDARGMPGLHRRRLHFALVGESPLAARMATLSLPASVRLGWRAMGAITEVKLSGADVAAVDGAAEQVRAVAAEFFIGDENATLATATLAAFNAAGLTIATAESCTGGGIGEALTAVPGSSSVVVGGFIAYANRAKTALLGVSEAMLAEHGAVSEPVALAMARGARVALATDWAVAVTGVAGPGGGSAEKPVGTVWIAWCGPGIERAARFHLPGDRAQVRARTLALALDGLRRGVETDAH
jgi:nicotinamide-nucleotide amidase